jgi:predicted MPP superfamily phosphohydrolase
VTNCDLDTRRAKGVSRWWPGAGYTGHGGGAVPSSDAPEDAAWLHVSAGLGTSPYAPVRFACRPEATLLTLVARDA